MRADAPLAYWRLGEPSGTALLEDQARANGTYSGGVVLGVAPAVSGSNTAARFDGGNDKGSVPDNASLDFGTGDFTVEAWIKTTLQRRARDRREALADGDRALLGAHRHRRLAPQRADPRRVLRRHQRPPGLLDRGVLDDAWHHVVVWYDRDAGITISVDGVTTFTALAIAPT